EFRQGSKLLQFVRLRVVRLQEFDDLQYARDVAAAAFPLPGFAANAECRCKQLHQGDLENLPAACQVTDCAIKRSGPGTGRNRRYLESTVFQTECVGGLRHQTVADSDDRSAVALRTDMPAGECLARIAEQDGAWHRQRLAALGGVVEHSRINGTHAPAFISLLDELACSIGRTMRLADPVVLAPAVELWSRDLYTQASVGAV